MPRQLKCPKCGTVNTIADGAKPTCAACGFGGPAGAAPPPAATAGPSQPAWGNQPAAAPAWGGPPMHGSAPTQRPGTVTAAAVLGFVAGGLDILIGALVLMGGLALMALGAAGSAASQGMDGGAFAAFGALLGVILLIVGGLAILMGVFYIVGAAGVLKGRRRNMLRTVAIVSGVLNLLNLLTGNLVAVLGLGLDVTIIVLLSIQSSNAWFAQRAGQPA